MKLQENSAIGLKKAVEVILIVVAIFLGNLFFFSVGFKSLDLRTTVVALCVTYVILRLWERRLDQNAKDLTRKQQKPAKDSL